jgi:hypothetical protein
MARAFGHEPVDRDDLAGELVVRRVLVEQLADVVRAFVARALGAAVLVEADDDAAPDVGPVLRVAVVLEQRVDQRLALAGALVGEELLGLVERRDLAHDVEVDAAHELGVARAGGRLEARLRPTWP